MEEKNSIKDMIPKYEDIMIDPALYLYNKEKDFHDSERTVSSPSAVELKLMRSMAVHAATDPSYTCDLSEMQLSTLGQNFFYAYLDAYRFHIFETVYNNTVLAIDSIDILRDSGFIYESNIRKFIYDAVYGTGIPNLFHPEIYQLFASTDIAKYVVRNEMMDENDMRRVTKEGLKNEMCTYGDLVVRQLYGSIMYAVEYACDAFFYNFDKAHDPAIVDGIVSVMSNVSDEVNGSHNPFTVVNKYVYANSLVKGSIAIAIQGLFGSFVNRFLCELNSIDEWATPKSIFTSLADIDSIERTAKNKKQNNSKIIEVPVHNCNRDYDISEMPF